MIPLRELTSQGEEALRRYLQAPEANPSPREIAMDDSLTVVVTNDVQVDPSVTFSTRLEAAETLYQWFRGAESHSRRRGVWSWLACLYFEQLRPRRKGLGAADRYILDEVNQRRFYRHLLRSPYEIFVQYRDNIADAMVLLCQPVNQPGDVIEQICGRVEYVRARAVVAAATRLYYDPRTRSIKRGAASKEARPGSVRRFTTVLNQLDVTYDLHALDGERLLRLLPSEFEQWLANVD